MRRFRNNSEINRQKTDRMQKQIRLLLILLLFLHPSSSFLKENYNEIDELNSLNLAPYVTPIFQKIIHILDFRIEITK